MSTPTRFHALDRLDTSRHLFVVGKTGGGKSTLFAALMARELEQGRGALLLDPHGDLALDVGAHIPRRRRNEVTWFDPTEPDCRGLNPFAKLAADGRGLAVSNLLAAMKKLFGSSWGPRTEHLTRHALLALTEVRGATLADAVKLLVDEKYRMALLRQVHDPNVRAFWLDEFPGYGKTLAAEAVAAPLNKLGALLADPRVRAVLTRSRPRLDVARVMERGGVVVARLPKGILGEDAVMVLGAVLLGALQAATMRRADVAEDARRPFTIVIDELAAFAPQPVLELIAEARKYEVAVVVATQSISALDPHVRSGLLANAGSIVSFRVSGEDAEILRPEFANELGVTTLTSLGVGSAVVRSGPARPRVVDFPP